MSSLLASAVVRRRDIDALLSLCERWPAWVVERHDMPHVLYDTLLVHGPEIAADPGIFPPHSNPAAPVEVVIAPGSVAPEIRLFICQRDIDGYLSVERQGAQVAIRLHRDTDGEGFAETVWESWYESRPTTSCQEVP